MEFISHRGNTNGREPSLENTPNHILNAAVKFRVEIDVWKINGEYFLGHDEPKHKIDRSFLLDDRLLLHCKNLDSFMEFGRSGFGESFFQTDELVVRTSMGNFLVHSTASQGVPDRSDVIRVHLNEDIPEVWENSSVISDHCRPRGMSNSPRAKPFDLLIIDIDGVMTTGVKYYDSTGAVVLKTYKDADFTAIKRFSNLGVKVCFLSGDEVVNKQMATLRGIDFIFARLPDGNIDKSVLLENLKTRYGAKTAAYIGDDYYDLSILDQVDFPFCPFDAIREVRQRSTILSTRGGEGVLAELFERTCGDIQTQYARDSHSK